LKRPAFTTQKAVVLNPMPTPSVRIAPSERVGYRNQHPDTRREVAEQSVHAEVMRRVHYLHSAAGVSAVTFFAGLPPGRSGLVHAQAGMVAP
jgi:hypothetical protein